MQLPFASANLDLLRLLGEKARLVVLNKSDLADPDCSRRALARLTQSGASGAGAAGAGSMRRGGGGGAAAAATAPPPAGALLVSALSRGSARDLLSAALRAAGARAAGSGGGGGGGGGGSRGALPSLLAVVGAPNTGKSRLINALKAAAAAPSSRSAAAGDGGATAGAVSAAKAKAGDTPGLTRQISAFQISSDPEAYVLDTPGVMQQKLRGREHALQQSLAGALAAGRCEGGGRHLVASGAVCVCVCWLWMLG